MKIFKFRPLVTETNFEFVRDILTTGHFWCSQFTELNDPMEGVFSIKVSPDTQEIMGYVLREKLSYKTCSFSGEEGFKERLMWCYYAHGFRGVAIQVEVDNRQDHIEKVRYVSSIRELDENVKSSQGDPIKELLKTKLGSWRHENEYRFLKSGCEENKQKIGKITGVYFGDPYRDFENKESIIRNSKIYNDYMCWKGKLKPVVVECQISQGVVFVRNGKVEVLEP